MYTKAGTLNSDRIEILQSRDHLSAAIVNHDHVITISNSPCQLHTGKINEIARRKSEITPSPTAFLRAQISSNISEMIIQ